jgi:hypothetical protein
LRAKCLEKNDAPLWIHALSTVNAKASGLEPIPLVVHTSANNMKQIYSRQWFKSSAQGPIIPARVHGNWSENVKCNVGFIVQVNVAGERSEVEGGPILDARAFER